MLKKGCQTFGGRSYWRNLALEDRLVVIWYDPKGPINPKRRYLTVQSFNGTIY